MSLAAAAGLSILQRQLLALNGDDVPLSDWECGFVADVCWCRPETLTPRQAATVALLCWRKREHIPAELVPATEPKLPKSDERPRR